MEKNTRTTSTKAGEQKHEKVRKQETVVQPQNADHDVEDGEKKALAEQITQLTEDLQRLQAEFANYKKANEKQQERFQLMTKAHFVQKLLPIVDAFETAFISVPAEDEFYQGMQLLYQQFWKILSQEGLRPIEITNTNGGGKVFDPHYHEVMLKVANDTPEDTIIGEIQRGYMLENMVLRHSKVKVSAGSEKKEPKESSDEKEATDEDTHRTNPDNQAV
ncbi:nucleotide exchange factor GrpE [Candidatus Woesearchaeota archaeon]|nr:nucleotide exchange factor GrpE [Candidatus Woesearchaeota archaeon]